MSFASDMAKAAEAAKRAADAQFVKDVEHHIRVIRLLRAGGKVIFSPTKCNADFVTRSDQCSQPSKNS